MNGRLDECVIKTVTQMLLYRRVCVLLLVVRLLVLFHCICSLMTMKVETELPSKNHQSTFTAITADTRTRTRKIRSDTMTVTAMTKAIVYLGLNYIFILFFFALSPVSPPPRRDLFENIASISL